jgi:hypothetical protein
MDAKFLVNQRVRELMTALNFSENVDGFYKKFMGDSSSERLRLVFNDKHPIKIEFLLEIAKNIGEKTGKKVNGHWLLMGDGEMFLDEKGTTATNSNEAALNKRIKELEAQLQQALDNNTGLIRANAIHAESFRDFLAGKMVKQG